MVSIIPDIPDYRKSMKKWTEWNGIGLELIGNWSLLTEMGKCENLKKEKKEKRFKVEKEGE